MKKTNKIQKIIIACIMILLVMIIKSNSVQAAELELVTYEDLITKSNHFYCMQPGATITSEGNYYNVSYYGTYRSDDSSYSRRVLAWILSNDSYYGSSTSNRSSTQKALWKWLGKSEGSNNGVYQEAQSLASESIPYTTSTSSTNVIKAGNTTLSMTGVKGVLNISSLNGNVTSVKVTLKSQKDGSSKTVTITSGSQDSSGIVGIYSNSSYTSSLNISNITAGKVYLKVLNTDYRITSVKISAQAENAGVKVKVWKYTCSTGQNLMKAKVYNGKKATGSVTFTADYSYGKIKLVKQGVYKTNGEEVTENATATFKIYCTTLGKWVAEGSNGYKYYVDSINNATAFTSGTTVSKLFAGYNYRIYEVSVDSEYYQDIKMYQITKTVNNTTSSIGFAQDSATGFYRTESIAVTDQDTTGTITLTIYDQRTRGDLTIYKIDKDTSVAISGVKIKIYQKDKGWLVQNSNGTYSYSNSTASATEFTTDSSGQIKLKCVLLGTFYVYETEAAENYDITAQEGYMNANGEDPYTFSKDNKWAYLGSKTLNTGENSVKLTVSNIGLASLQIAKKDYTTGIDLSGGEFKIYAVLNNGTSGWLSGDVDGTKTYGITADTYSSLTTLKNLKYGTYYVYETKTPDGYDITKQDGYKQENEGSSSLTGDWAYLGNITLNTSRPDGASYFTLEVTNKKIVDELEGYVWVDEPDTKGNETDYVYNSSSNDYLKSGITVNLYDGNGTLLATTVTDSSGYYKFTTKNASSYTGTDKNIYYWDLATAYVEFIYDNTEYIVVDPFEGSDISVNSKAQEYTVDTVELDDNSLTGTTGDNPGKAVTYQGSTLTTEQLLSNTESVQSGSADLSQTPLSGYYDNSTYKVSDINLGLIEQIDPTYSVDETLEYIKIAMNGYIYTYKYGDESITTSDYVPTTNIQNSSKTFTASIYPSDIAYNSENTGALSVYVVYGISVTNTSNLAIDDQYVEETLYLDSLTNVYDNERYALWTSNDTNDTNGEDFARWSDNGTASFTYDDGTTAQVAQTKYDLSSSGNAYEAGIKSGETKTSYVQFKVTEDALNKILSGGLTYEDIETAPTIATTSGYHEYLRTDNAWVHNSEVVAFDGAKGTYSTSNSEGDKYYVHKSLSVIHSSGALYLRLSLGESRTVSGTVFEDTQTDESEAENTNLGNGILDSDEGNRGNKVTVELLDSDMEVTTLYQVNSENETGYSTAPAQTETEIGGTYTFEGVVPGYYYIRFTYGDGTQTIVDTDGNEVSLTSNDYRSTIINTDEAGDIIKNAMEASSTDLSSAQQALVADYTNEDAKKLVEWYKYLDGDYSTAVDDISQRNAVDGYVYNEDGTIYDENGNVVTDYPTNVNSYTPMIGISIENDIESTSTSTTNGNTHLTNYGGFNFGIIKQADTIITLSKEITNVDLTTQTGSIIVSANPVDDESTYMSDLDKTSTTGSTYARIEIDPDVIYGSGLETTYTITITNNTAIDYIEDEDSDYYGYYYRYGEITSTATQKEITIGEVTDELDSKYAIDSALGDAVETLSSSEEESSVTISEATSLNTTIDENGTETTTTTNTISITGWESISTSESTSTSYTVTSLVSTDDDETSYTNAAKITTISLDSLSTLTTEYNWNDEDTTILAITPTTGEDRSNTYWIVGTISLVVIAMGFVVLKKKVLR